MCLYTTFSDNCCHPECSLIQYIHVNQPERIIQTNELQVNFDIQQNSIKQILVHPKVVISDEKLEQINNTLLKVKQNQELMIKLIEQLILIAKNDKYKKQEHTKN